MSSKSASTLSELLQKSTVKDLVGQSRDVVMLTTKDEVGLALKTLSFHDIISAVLIDPECGKLHNIREYYLIVIIRDVISNYENTLGEYKGFVDMMDIVSYALFSADCLRLTLNHRDLTQVSNSVLILLSVKVYLQYRSISSSFMRLFISLVDSNWNIIYNVDGIDIILIIIIIIITTGFFGRSSIQRKGICYSTTRRNREDS